MKTISWILLTSMIFYCCSSTHWIKHDQSAFEELNKNAQGNKIQITLMNNEVIDADNITVGADSSSWVKTVESRKPIEGGQVYYSEEKDRAVATEDIATIYIKNVTKGFGLGLAVGGAAALLAYACTPSGGLFPKEDFWWIFLTPRHT